MRLRELLFLYLVSVLMFPLFAQPPTTGRSILTCTTRVEAGSNGELRSDQARMGAFNSVMRRTFAEFDISALKGKTVCGVGIRVYNDWSGTNISQLAYSPIQPSTFASGSAAYSSVTPLPTYRYAGFSWTVNADDQWTPGPTDFYRPSSQDWVTWQRGSGETIVKDLQSHIDNGLDWFALMFANDSGGGRANLKLSSDNFDPKSIYLEITTLEVDLRQTENEMAQNTDAFKLKKPLILRRNSVKQSPSKPTEIHIKSYTPYDPAMHDLKVVATHEFDGIPVEIPLPMAMGTPTDTDWAIKVNKVSPDGRTLHLWLYIPKDAPIGKYDFKYQMFLKSAPLDPICEAKFPEDVIVLFNPWSTEDEVYLPTAANRKEYVQEKNGNIWRSMTGASKSWDFAQFEEVSLRVTLALLDGLDAMARKSSITISRHLSRLVNSNDEGGVLTGKWKTPYTGGTRPSSWTGSEAILTEYEMNGSVSYGQCWVFAGVLTTNLRAIGIPCRPVTNFLSGHDSNGNKDIDYYYDASGSFDQVKTADRVWNYHVWTEAWMKRPDWTGADGWQAVDATPQEPSGGYFQLGPAPVEAVYFDSGGDYDVDFVFSEVDADVVEWMQGKPSSIARLTAEVGFEISTKTVGSMARNDITSNYKTPEPTPKRLLGSQSIGSSGVEVALTSTTNAYVGDDLVWTLTLENNSPNTRTCQITLESHVIAYNGEHIDDLLTDTSSLVLGSGTTTTLSLTATEADYLPWIDRFLHFQSTGVITVVETGESTAVFDRNEFIRDGVALNLSPNQPMFVGESVNVASSFTNPLTVSMTDVHLTYTVANGLEVDGSTQSDIVINEIMPGETILRSKQIYAVSPGEHLVAVTLSSMELDTEDGSVLIEVLNDCNGNSVVDSQDILDGISDDCNGNGIPDECEIATGVVSDVNGNGIPDGCETDCDLSGLPDDYEIAQGLTPDCNNNGIPDACDIFAATSSDTNFNGIPDECDPDCNNNGIPDDLDISNGTEPDCNDNGVPDACDIASQSSDDADSDGVPDECEHPQITQPAPDSQLPGPDVTFQWDDNDAPILDYRLDVGSTSGGSDLFNGTPLGLVQSQAVGQLPVDARTIHVRLHYLLGTTWRFIDATYTAARLAQLTAPVPGSDLAGPNPTFAWTANGLAVDEWQIDLGSSSGASDLFQSGPLASGTTSQAVTGLPTDGRQVYARLSYTIGATTDTVLATYTAAQLPELTGPVPGSTLSSGTANFVWIDNGASVTDWQLYVGTTQGTSNLFNSGVLSAGTRSLMVDNLPVDGSTLHVRLRYRIDGSWSQRDVTYTADRQAQIVAPANHQLTSDSAAFQWTANGLNVSQWRLEIGSNPGADDLHQSGVLAGATLSRTVNNLPVDGRVLYVRLSYQINAVWASVDSTYTAVGDPVIVAPAPGGILPGFAAVFEIDPKGTAIEYWQIYAGSTQGAYDHFRSSNVGGATLSMNVSNLPTDGSTVWIRLRYRINLTWYERDFQYTASSVPGGPTFTNPVPGSTLSGFATQFTYTGDGGDIEYWRIEAGSTQGAYDHFRSSNVSGTTLSMNVSNLPTDGSTVWIRLNYRINLTWYERDFQYTASSVPGGPTFTNPVPGSTLSGFATQFTYTGDGGDIEYWRIEAGSTQGAYDHFRSSNVSGTTLSMNVSNLPTDGSTVWIRLNYRINLTWHERDFQYTASSVPGGPTFTNPTPGSILPGATTTFTYTADGGDIEYWWLYAGSTLGGNDYGTISNLSGSTTMVTLNNLPTDGSTVYIRLGFRINTTWYWRNFTFVASTAIP